jgi:hypothetical protein
MSQLLILETGTGSTRYFYYLLRFILFLEYQLMGKNFLFLSWVRFFYLFLRVGFHGSPQAGVLVEWVILTVYTIESVWTSLPMGNSFYYVPAGLGLILLVSSKVRGLLYFDSTSVLASFSSLLGSLHIVANSLLGCRENVDGDLIRSL